jgi:hypothetical protein
LIVWANYEKPPADLQRLSDLPPVERERVRYELHAAHAEARAQGWQAWEIDEPVASVARKLGVRLSADEKRAILAARC